MTTTPQSYATFSIESGCLCFGELHNIWSGSLVPIQGFPSIQPDRSGTVKAHRLKFNIPARNGTWQAFQLVDIETEVVSGWFLWHSDVDPGREIARILRVSGSPYEPDSGSTMNNEKTRAEGVLVINRYDWGYYDARCRDEMDEELGGPDPERRTADVEFSESVGVVDYAQAKSQVAAWKVQSPDRQCGCEAGVWMRIPMAEYKIGRFGFNDDRVAHSFLFFSGGTHFTQTSLAGHSRPLREPETDVESRKVSDFLESRATGQSVVIEEFVSGIARVVAYLISEVLEVSSNAAICSQRYGIVPADIRISVYSDPELYDVFQYSTVLWKGHE
ncbi:unnamed protein product [Aspergillus oryzae var. brunneus]|uniref:Unnamed protein product n=1 Tax=Aspergillus oryzae var. brunneus TaxID=332754 RepID=A0ABQ6KXS0_ASPOZ|nr:unnamed protein product [Aspergillus oryzae var. brunneus]